MLSIEKVSRIDLERFLCQFLVVKVDNGVCRVSMVLQIDVRDTMGIKDKQYRSVEYT